jgi:predicted dehydrogenase
MARKFVIIGMGHRSEMYTTALTKDFSKTSKLMAVCDNNVGRLNLAINKLKPLIPDIAGYEAKDFDKMLAEQKPDCVIVTTKDCTHDDYVCRAMEAGCDTITEKPMTMDEVKCQRIIDTVKKTGKSLMVAFNYRYAPPRTQVKELLTSGIIGKILSVDFHWMLDTNHGADYYRRWHANKANSGGLMVHKATHHFDLVNWWLSSIPEFVFARGKRAFYDAKQAKLYGLEKHSDRCTDCPVASKCNFYMNMRDFPVIKALFVDNEKYDSYYRDRCVFRDDIDIEDTMNVVVQYKSGAIMSYSLNSFMPYEGYKIAFNGTKGRLEHGSQESSYISGDGSVQGALVMENVYIKVYPHFQTAYNIEVRTGKGEHGGGDIVMLKDIFGQPDPNDPLMRAADFSQGAYSILTGIAANKSMASGKMIKIDDLVKGLEPPRMPKMQGEDDSIPFTPDSKRNARITIWK